MKDYSGVELPDSYYDNQKQAKKVPYTINRTTLLTANVTPGVYFISSKTSFFDFNRLITSDTCKMVVEIIAKKVSNPSSYADSDSRSLNLKKDEFNNASKNFVVELNTLFRITEDATITYNVFFDGASSDSSASYTANGRIRFKKLY